MIEVVYVCGAGRSGSTILEAIISQRTGYVAVGELDFVWTRGLIANELCGCGIPFRSCPFWTAVFDDAFGGFDKVDAEHVAGLAARAVRTRAIPALHWTKLRRPGLSECLDELGPILRRLYEGIANVAGSSTIVDSSKDPRYGFLLATVEGLQLHPIHLVRDSRAVGHSWQQVQLRPEVHWEERFMEQFTARQVAWIWIYSNVTGTLLRRSIAGSTSVRYEDLASDPHQLDALLEGVGPLQADRSPSDRTIHSVAGNPARFDPDRVLRMRFDGRWIGKLSTRDFVLLTAATGPMLLHYRYPLSRRQCRRWAIEHADAAVLGSEDGS